MAQALKTIAGVLVLAYAVAVFVFAKDPLGLVLKNKAVAEEIVACGGADFVPTNRRETEVLAKRFITTGVRRAEIEQRFNTRGEDLGPIFKKTLFVCEAKYIQYAFDLGYGVTAYVLFDTYSNRVSNHEGALKLNEPH